MIVIVINRMYEFISAHCVRLSLAPSVAIPERALSFAAEIVRFPVPRRIGKTPIPHSAKTLISDEHVNRIFYKNIRDSVSFFGRGATKPVDFVPVSGGRNASSPCSADQTGERT